MAVDQAKIVDAIGIDPATGEVVLTISDHLDWGNGEHHLQALQEKLNTYISFVESGELHRVYPDSSNRTVLIDLVARHEFTPEAERFFALARSVMDSVPIRFRARVLRTAAN